MFSIIVIKVAITKPMTTRYLVFLCCIFISLSCNDGKKAPLAIVEEPLKEVQPTTLFLSDFGLYITNWPRHWVLANHGNGCSTSENSASFIFGSHSTTYGTLEIDCSGAIGNDYFSTFEVTKRDVWQQQNSVDLEMETVDEGQVKLKFFNLNRSYEKWAVGNFGFLPPVEETEIKEVSFPRFPIFAPQKNQNINILLGFNVLTDNRDYQISFQNQTSRLGVSCTLRANVNGNVVTSLGKNTIMLAVGDRIDLEAKEEHIRWQLLRKQDQFSIIEMSDGKTSTLFEIPVSKDYDFTFYAKED